MPDDDTVEFTCTEAMELLAMLDHECTPRWWPHRVGDVWECECGHRFVCCDCDGTLGWRTA